uniref:ECF transporter S component n=1 Tax=Eubacterium cellulosolvens TaxID=29322 RepID=UPI00048921E0|nr:ECF transporter S component [[Eubacterium] cellulosolvens]
MKEYSRVQKMVGTAVLAAIVVVLQTVASGIHVGPFTITLSLVPIIIGAIMFGPVSGAVLGAVFGIVVATAVVVGADQGGAIMFSQNPVATILICLLKSTVAGFVAGLISHKAASKKLMLGVVLAAIAAPVCNTGIFVLGLSTVFGDLLREWATASGFGNAFVYIVVGLVGLNFLIELLVDIILAPIIVSIVKTLRRAA